MENLINIFNNQLTYKNNEIKIIIDNNNIIWFKFNNISNILNYKSSKDTLRDNVDKENKIHLKNLKLLFKIKNEHPNTIYINEIGLYTLLIKSKQKKAKEFQKWIINDILPSLRKHGKYEVNKKIKLKIKNLNNKINILIKENETLKQNMINNNYPSGTHIYVIEDNNKYKIGYTSNLKKRLAVYNTNKSDKISYAFYKKTKCAKEIESYLKALLNKYLYRKNSEYYNCDLDIIIEKIKKCLKFEKTCKNCNDITNNNQIGGNLNIIENLITNYQNKLDNYINNFNEFNK